MSTTLLSLSCSSSSSSVSCYSPSLCNISSYWVKFLMHVHALYLCRAVVQEALEAQRNAAAAASRDRCDELKAKARTVQKNIDSWRDATVEKKGRERQTLRQALFTATTLSKSSRLEEVADKSTYKESSITRLPQHSSSMVSILAECDLPISCFLSLF